MEVFLIALKLMFYAMAVTAGVVVAVPLIIIAVCLGLVFFVVAFALLAALFGRKK